MDTTTNDNWTERAVYAVQCNLPGPDFDNRKSPERRRRTRLVAYLVARKLDR